MSLVAYGSSDEETEEEISPKEENLSSNVSKTLEIVAAKKQRESVKITIPSLKQFEEEEKDEVPKKKPKFQSGSGSGLFRLLPPPKNSSTLAKSGFVPYALSKKDQKSPFPVTKSKTPIAKNHDVSSTPSSEIEQDSDDDVSNESDKKIQGDSTSSGTDFFSLDATTERVSSHSYEPSDYSGLAISPALSQNKPFIAKQSYDPCISSTAPIVDSTPVQDKDVDTLFTHEASLLDATQNDANYQSEYSSEPNPTDALLKDEAFLKLQGRRREFEGIDIIDVNAADQLMDRKEWLMKSLTEETTHRPSRKKHNMPTSQQKRKHQITYLAFQAKEREMDLKNQWSLNSRTRRETQAKYGF